MTTNPGLFFTCSEKAAYACSVIGNATPPDFMSSGSPVEKVIWPATATNAVNRIVIIVPISQPAGSINRSLEDVKNGRKRGPVVLGLRGKLRRVHVPVA